MPTPPEDPTYERIVRVIQGVIRACELSQIEIDRRIGRREGYLSHVFHGRVQFKVRDLVGVVRELGLDPAAIFGYLVVDPAEAPPPAAGGPKGAAAQASPHELSRFIAALLDAPEGPSPADDAGKAQQAEPPP